MLSFISNVGCLYFWDLFFFLLNIFIHLFLIGVSLFSIGKIRFFFLLVEIGFFGWRNNSSLTNNKKSMYRIQLDCFGD